MNNRCIIIAGGDVQISRMSHFLSKNDYIIAADSGYRYCEDLGLRPDLLVGDFDSYSGDLPQNTEIIKLPKQKDDTDLLFALRCGVGRCFKAVVIFGGYGSRPDQNFAMYQSLLWLKRELPDSTCTAFCKGFEISVLQNESRCFSVGKDRYISVFAFGGNATVSIKGADYPLEDYLLTPSFPIGVSNEADGECFVTVKSGSVIVMTVNKDI